MDHPDRPPQIGQSPSGPLAIEDYAIIGDCSTCALVGRNGSIDWLCWPRFDSPACFSALVGDSRNGRWLIAPSGSGANIARSYRGDSLILETVFETDEGSFAVIDFMPPLDARSGAAGTGVARAPLRRGEKPQEKIEAQLGAIKRMPRLIRSFFKAPSVSYITDWLVTRARANCSKAGCPRNAYCYSS
jgi:hypothetical protein